MDPEAKKGEKSPPVTEADTPKPILLHPEEWKDPVGVKVIQEHYKDGLPGTDAGDESDLDAFEKGWNPIGGSRTAGEYHKKDSPSMEAWPDRDDHQLRTRETPRETPGEESSTRKESHRMTGSKAAELKVSADNLLEKATRKVTGGDDGRPRTAKATRAPAVQPVVDISTVEVLAFTIFRAMFGKGIRVPLKVEGSMDMDIAVKDTDVVINTNDVTFEPPKLQIWHFIIAYKGKPVIEYGRGVERVKVHYYQAFVMLMAMWWGSKKKRKAKKKADKAADVELTRYAATGERPSKGEDINGEP